MTLNIPDREMRIFRAISDARETSIRAASKLETVPRSTLRDRINGAQPTQIAHEKFLSLTPLQEKELVDLIILREKAFQPLLKSEIHLYAQHLAELNGLGPHLGKNWVDRFFRRHTSVILKPSRLVSTARRKTVTEEGLREYYRGLLAICKELSIGSDRIYNLDETGVQEGESLAGVVAGTVLTTSSEKIQSDASAWISILETISATGQRLTPCIVYTGKTSQGQNFGDFIPDWKYTCSEKGWSNTEILLRWFYDVFLPETTPKDPSQWRLLVLDQHKTHISVEFMKKAYMNKVWLSWLPSHSSHITQPLDVGIFAALKRYYRAETAGMHTYEATSSRQKQIFATAYKIASNKAFSQDNIRNAFKASGIYPIDVEKAVLKLKPKERRSVISNPLTTPPIQAPQGDNIFATPSSSHDIEKLFLKVNWASENVQRDIRLILRKAGKSLDQKIAENCTKDEAIAIIRAREAAQRPSGRSQVNFDPNQAFPDIPQLISARDRAERNTWKLNNEPAAEIRPKKRKKTQTTK
ncbi:hypothetical protein FOMA001_g18117 [Fusarium oxysporum f. sp. matthiolae]|nr:hypothetical protein FOMA001_g18117 [Fusarium oxysporum f. sp. matthiolae]